MLKTPLCDLFGIEVPIILAPMGTCTSAEFAAAVSNEGGLGGIGSLFRSTAAVKRDIDMASWSFNQAVALTDKYYTEHPEDWHLLMGQGIIKALTVKGSPCDGTAPKKDH